MNNTIADISSFEALTSGSAGPSMSMVPTKRDVAVQNVDIGLLSLANLLQDEELTSLVGYLQSKGRLEYADGALRGHTMSSVEELKKVLLYGIGMNSKDDLTPKTEPKPEKKKGGEVRQGSEEKLGWWARRKRLNQLAKQGRKAIDEKNRLLKQAKKDGKTLGVKIQSEDDFLKYASSDARDQYTKLDQDFKKYRDQWYALRGK